MQGSSFAKGQCNTCKHILHIIMKYPSMNVESLDLMKLKGFIYFDCIHFYKLLSKKYKQNRIKGTPIKNISLTMNIGSGTNNYMNSD